MPLLVAILALAGCALSAPSATPPSDARIEVDRQPGHYELVGTYSGPVVDGLTYFVLQVHSFERPKTIEDAMTICPVDRVPGYVSEASQVGVPFFVA